VRLSRLNGLGASASRAGNQAECLGPLSVAAGLFQIAADRVVTSVRNGVAALRAPIPEEGGSATVDAVAPLARRLDMKKAAN
jgi:hypothetical protein